MTSRVRKNLDWLVQSWRDGEVDDELYTTRLQQMDQWADAQRIKLIGELSDLNEVKSKADELMHYLRHKRHGSPADDGSAALIKHGC